MRGDWEAELLLLTRGTVYSGAKCPPPLPSTFLTKHLQEQGVKLRTKKTQNTQCVVIQSFWLGPFADPSRSVEDGLGDPKNGRANFLDRRTITPS